MNPLLNLNLHEFIDALVARGNDESLVRQRFIEIAVNGAKQLFGEKYRIQGRLLAGLNEIELFLEVEPVVNVTDPCTQVALDSIKALGWSIQLGQRIPIPLNYNDEPESADQKLQAIVPLPLVSLELRDAVLVPLSRELMREFPTSPNPPWPTYPPNSVGALMATPQNWMTGVSGQFKSANGRVVTLTILRSFWNQILVDLQGRRRDEYGFRLRVEGLEQRSFEKRIFNWQHSELIGPLKVNSNSQDLLAQQLSDLARRFAADRIQNYSDCVCSLIATFTPSPFPLRIWMYSKSTDTV